MGFEGYKAHVAVDPDSEIITATTVSPGNTADGAVAEALIADLHGAEPDQQPADDQPAGKAAVPGDEPVDAQPATVSGDNAYGTGEFQERLEEAGVDSRCKTPSRSSSTTARPTARRGDPIR